MAYGSGLMETFAALLALSERNSPINRDSPHKGPVMRSDVFVTRPNKILNKQLSCRLFEMHKDSCDIIAVRYAIENE